jgi:predicted small lipoprotein YifL
MQRKNFFLQILLIVLIISIQACGQTGELYLPIETEVRDKGPITNLEFELNE